MQYLIEHYKFQHHTVDTGKPIKWQLQYQISAIIHCILDALWQPRHYGTDTNVCMADMSGSLSPIQPFSLTLSQYLPTLLSLSSP